MTQPGAPQPLGMSDFFALEAGEYLDRLDALLQPPAPPAAEELVRLARALRGSALMASQQGIARAAMGFEAFARGVREGRRPWDAATKQIAIRSVDDLKIFVRKAASWTEADTAKAEALASQLEQFGGRPSAQVRAAEAIGLDAGARAFVAREGAAIASALDRAGRALRANPIAHDPLQQVLKALQPLRGLAALNDLPPLPDLLEGIEQAIGQIGRTIGAPPAGGGDTIAELFQMAATSIAHAAREVAERGRPDPESAEFRKFARLLVQFIDSEPDVVPIETVATMVRRGTPPGVGATGGTGESARPSTLSRLELVSHGEHLRQAADSLERAPSATQRELRAHTLAGTFRALSSAGGGPVTERVAEFAQAAREASRRSSPRRCARQEKFCPRPERSTKPRPPRRSRVSHLPFGDWVHNLHERRSHLRNLPRQRRRLQDLPPIACAPRVRRARRAWRSPHRIWQARGRGMNRWSRPAWDRRPSRH